MSAYGIDRGQESKEKTRMSNETPEYITQFARAIAPDSPELLLSTNEQNILTTATQKIIALEAERDALRAKLARALHELGLTAAQRTSYEAGGDEYSDHRGAYDIIIEQTRKALAAIKEE